MYTVKRLLDIALEASKVVDARVAAGFGPGTVDKERNDARKLSEQALNAADYMEQAGLTEVEYIGSFGEHNFKRGSVVRLKAGAIYTQRGETKVNRRNRRITVSAVFDGYTPDHYNNREHSIRNPQISWAGTGGYWCHVDMNSVEAI